jgi:hypothetical protein
LSLAAVRDLRDVRSSAGPDELAGQCCIGRSVRVTERADENDRLSDGRPSCLPAGTRRISPSQPAGICGPSGTQCIAAASAGRSQLMPAGLNGVGWAHDPEVAGSNPAPATRKLQVRGPIAGDGGRAFGLCGSAMAAAWAPTSRWAAGRPGIGRHH